MRIYETDQVFLRNLHFLEGLFSFPNAESQGVSKKTMIALEVIHLGCIGNAILGLKGEANSLQCSIGNQGYSGFMCI